MSDSQVHSQSTPSEEHSELDATHSIVRKKGWSKFTSLDGTSRAFTISVLTTLAFGITTLYFDRGFMEDENSAIIDQATPEHTFSAAGRQVFRVFMLLLMCLSIAVLVFGLMYVNVYPFKKNKTLHQNISMILAVVCLIGSNTLGIIVLVDTEITFQNHKDEAERFQSAPAHYFLFLCFVLSIFWMDYLFITVVFVGKYLEIQQYKSQWKFRLTSASKYLGSRKDNAYKESSADKKNFKEKVATALHNGFSATLEKIVDAVYHGILFVQNFLGAKQSEEDVDSGNLWKALSISFSDIFLNMTESVVKSSPMVFASQSILYISWDFWEPVRNCMQWARDKSGDDKLMSRAASGVVKMTDGVFISISEIRFHFRNQIDYMYDSIREDKDFKHSGWVLAAVGTSMVLLLYFGVAISMNVSSYLREVYMERRDCVVITMEENGDFGNFILRLAGFTEASTESEVDAEASASSLRQTACSAQFVQNNNLNLNREFTLGPESTSNDLLDVMYASNDPYFQQVANTSTRVGSDVAEDRLYSCALDSFSSQSCYSLSVLNLIESQTSQDLQETKSPMDVFQEHGLGQTVYIMDAMLRHVRHTLWLGLIVGLSVGFYSLLSVLGQYKRLSLAIRSGLFDDLSLPSDIRINTNRSFNLKRAESVIGVDKWSELIEMYPMGTSVFFFGILVSTAVIQLVVFGSAISVMLAFLVGLFDSHVFAILRPILALLLAFIVTWLLNGPLAQLVLSEGILVSKYHIFHEFSFLMFLIVYTALHLVLGVFLALMRLIWVMLTSIARLNRLDKNLFPALQRLDLGHKSFMAMVLMNHAFRLNAHEHDSAMSKKELGAHDDSSSTHEPDSQGTSMKQLHPSEKTVTFAEEESTQETVVSVPMTEDAQETQSDNHGDQSPTLPRV